MCFDVPHPLPTGTSLSTTNPTRTGLGVTDTDNVNHTNVLTIRNWLSKAVKLMQNFNT